MLEGVLERWCTPRRAIPLAIAVGGTLRLARIARAPLVHPDGPAYLALASGALHGEWSRLFGGYYSPLYPLAIAPLVALGIGPELAGRLAATLAGLAVLPVVHRLARLATADDRIAAAATLAAALSPALVKASAQVLPETLAGLFVATAVVGLAGGGGAAAVAAGVAAGLAYLARPEGALLVPLGVAWLVGRRRLAAAVAFAATALAVMTPALLALHERSGVWQLSPREAVLAGRAGLGGGRSLAAAAARSPLRFVGLWARGAAAQTWNTLVALGPVLVWPCLAGLALRPATRTTALVALAFTVGPIALNPSPRYAVPVLPLLLVGTGAGIAVLARRLGARAAAVAVAAVVVLAVQGLWKSHDFTERCARELHDTIVARWGRGATIVAVDGRIAYGVGGTPVVPSSTDPATALALARSRGARLWVARPAWQRGFVPPADVREAARPCGGTFVLYEIGATP